MSVKIDVDYLTVDEKELTRRAVVLNLTEMRKKLEPHRISHNLLPSVLVTLNGREIDFILSRL